MAFPTTIFSGGGIGGHQPPVKSSAGAFYAIVPISSTAIEAYKATDPEGGSWSAVDVGANNPAGFGTLSVMSYVQAGDKIHVCTWDGTIYEYHRFDMSDDTWERVDTSLGTVTNAPTFPWCSIAVRNDGDIICVIAGDTDRVMGGDKERVDYVESTDDGANWGTHTALDAAGDVHYGNPNVVKGPLTDDMHIAWLITTQTADPPISWEDTEARTLDSSNTLSALVSSTFGSSGLLPVSKMVAYEDGGVQRVAWLSSETNAIQIFRSTESGSDDIQAPSRITSSAEFAYESNELGINTMAEEAGSLHFLYSGGGTSGVDQDIYYTDSTDDGATISTITEQVDAVTCNYISSNIYQRGADQVLAFVYDDAGTIKYNEKVLTTLSYTQLDSADFGGLVNAHVGPFEI